MIRFSIPVRPRSVSLGASMRDRGGWQPCMCAVKSDRIAWLGCEVMSDTRFTNMIHMKLPGQYHQRRPVALGYERRRRP